MTGGGVRRAWGTRHIGSELGELFEVPAHDHHGLALILLLTKSGPAEPLVVRPLTRPPGVQVQA